MTGALKRVTSVRLKPLLLALFFFFSTICSVLSQTTYALTPAEENEYLISTYGKEAGICSSGATSIAGSSNFERIARYFSSKGLKDTAITGILANLQNESHLTAFAVQGQTTTPTTHSIPPEGPKDGYGIAQFTPASKISAVLKSDPRTSEFYLEYYSTLFGNYLVTSWDKGGTGIPPGVPENVNSAWLETQLDFFYKGELQTTKVGTYRKAEGGMGLDYIQDSDTIIQALNNAKDEKDAARIFMWIYERPSNKPTHALERETVAGTMIGPVRNLLGTSAGASGCSQLSLPGNGTSATFIDTVKSFAWEDGRRQSIQKPAYTETIKQSKYGNDAAHNYGNDCGAFVYNLMQKSGYEPKYPPTYTGGQEPWLEANWQKIASVGQVDVSQLRPGDVGIVPGSHVFVWIGDVPGFAGKSAEAALGSNTAPTANKSTNTYSAPSKYTWYRKKGA